MSRPPMPIDPNIRYTNDDGCWEWTGALNAKGYGGLVRKLNGVYVVGAHRVIWTLNNGPIPAGISVLHHCDNPPCVRLSHLFLGTKSDNNKDRAAKGRSSRGPAHPKAKLTEQDVRDIRRLYSPAKSGRGGPQPTSGPTLAARFGVSPHTIHGIIHRWTWKHVKPEPDDAS